MAAPRLSRIAMGYEVSVTPLQMAMVVSSIANRGALMKPRPVDRSVSYDKKEVEVLPPVIVRQACSAATARKIADSLEAAVVEGTGKQAAIEQVSGWRARPAPPSATIPEAKGKDKYPDGHFVVSFGGLCSRWTVPASPASL